MSDAQTSLIQFAFYGAYFCVAFPASLFIRRHSYKSGVILGLALYASGAILFLPAARAGDSVIGASGLIMAILGGAVLTPLQGLLSDAADIYVSFLIPAFCFAMVLSYALYVIHLENKTITAAASLEMSQYAVGAYGSDCIIYHNVADSGVLVKMYKPGYSEAAVRREIDVTAKVWEMGIPCPEPGDLVTDGTRLGIRYVRVENKRSYSRMFSDEPERTEELSRELARVCRRLHCTECDGETFERVELRYLSMLDSLDLPEDEKTALRSFIGSVPTADTALHGDFHMGNVVSTLPEGAGLEENHEVKFIDLDRFCCGNPLWDLGAIRRVCLDIPDDYLFEKFHIHRAQAADVWKYFADEYFGGSKSLEEVELLVKPFSRIIGLLL